MNCEKSWSPFSTPSIYENNQSFIYFQYSALSTVSNLDQLPNETSLPKPICRPIPKCFKRINSRHSNKNVMCRNNQASKTSLEPSSTKTCSFCKSNGEPIDVYSSHSLKNAYNSVSCPVLKSYACEVCGAKGAHTIKYCPVYLRRTKLRLMKHFNVKKI